MARARSHRPFFARAQLLLADQPGSFVSRPVDHWEFQWGGIPGDRHFGLTKPAGSREPWYPAGTVIANRRQLTVVGALELAAIADQLGLAACRGEWLGANVVLDGVPAVTDLPAGTRMLWPSGASLAVEGENRPCRHPGQVIAEATGRVELAARFVAAARGRRGVICIVEHPGPARSGEMVTVFLPRG